MQPIRETFRILILGVFIVSAPKVFAAPLLFDQKLNNACKPGEIIPNSFIVKYRAAASFQTLSAQDKEKSLEQIRTRLSLRKVHVYKEVSDRLEQVESIATNAMALERAVHEGILEYAIPNRVVCANDNGLSVSGRVRMLGTAVPPFPRTILAGADGSLTSISSSLGVKELNLSTTLSQNPPKYLYLQPRSLVPWDRDDDARVEFLSNTKLQFIAANGINYQDSLQNFAHDAVGNPLMPNSDPLGASITGVYLYNWEPLAGGGERFVFFGGNRLYALEHGISRVFADFPETPVGLGDFDGDSDLDVVTATRREESYEIFFYRAFTNYRIYKQISPGNFVRSAQFEVEELDHAYYMPSIVVVDLNRDGKSDMVSRFSSNKENFGTYINQGDDMHFSAKLWHLNDSNGASVPLANLWTTDIDRDGDIDLVSHDYSTYSWDCVDDKVYSIINAGDGTWVSSQETAVNNCISGLSISDLDGDGLLDLTLGADKELRIYLNSSSKDHVQFVEQSVLQLANKPFVTKAYDPMGLNAVEVTLTSLNGQIYKAHTNLNGDYSIRNLAPGAYRIQAQYRGYEFLSEVGESFNLTSERKDINLQALTLLESPSGFVRPAGAPNDMGFGKQWALYNFGQNGGIPEYDISALEAWKLSTGSPEIIVGILDAGIDYNHPDLRENIWTNKLEIPRDGVDNDGNGYVDDWYGVNAAGDGSSSLDVDGHGTHVSGIVAARANNTYGLSGIAPKVRLMPLRVINGQGGGSDAAILQGLAYALGMRRRGENIRVINASLGYVGPCSQAYIDVLSALNQVGVTFVAAAGNGGPDQIADNNDLTPFSPSICPVENIISVANLNSNGNLAPSSNFGPNTVDLAAPGTDIWSTCPNGTYCSLDGTSMAAPYVSGAAALVLSIAPKLSPADVRTILMQSVRPLAQLVGKLASPGFLNAYQALKLSQQFSGSAPGNGNQPGQNPSMPQSLANYKPSTAQFSQQGKKLVINMETQSGVYYLVHYKIHNSGHDSKKPKQKSKAKTISSQNSQIIIKRPSPGSIVTLTYQLISSNNALNKSLYSPTGRVKIKYSRKQK